MINWYECAEVSYMISFVQIEKNSSLILVNTSETFLKLNFIDLSPPERSKRKISDGLRIPLFFDLMTNSQSCHIAEKRIQEKCKILQVFHQIIGFVQVFYPQIQVFLQVFPKNIGFYRFLPKIYAFSLVLQKNTVFSPFVNKKHGFKSCTFNTSNKKIIYAYKHGQKRWTRHISIVSILQIWLCISSKSTVKFICLS